MTKRAISVTGFRHPMVLFAAVFHAVALSISIFHMEAIIGTLIWSIVSLFIAMVIARSWQEGTIFLYHGYGTNRDSQPSRFYRLWIGSVVFWGILNVFFGYGFLVELGYLPK